MLIEVAVSNLYSSLLQMIFPQVMGNYIFKVLAVNTAGKKITNSIMWGVSGTDQFVMVVVMFSLLVVSMQ